MLLTCALFVSLARLPGPSQAAETPNLCPNPGAEDANDAGDAPGAWYAEGGEGAWAQDQVHSGQRSLKLVRDEPGRTVGWTSPVIPVGEEGAQFVLSVWVRMESVTGNHGAFIGFYHTDEQGERIGQSGGIAVGGVGDEVTTADWQESVSVSELTPEVKGVRINLRLYGASGTAWFDDIKVHSYTQRPIQQPRPIRKGLRLDRLAIVSPTGADGQAERIAAALRDRGTEAAVIPDAAADLPAGTPDLIILGSLTTSRAAAYLYEHSYTYEDLYFPGAGGYVLRPLIDPLGTGANFLVVGASDAEGIRAGSDVLLAAIRKAGDTLDLPLTVETGEDYGGLDALPWRFGGPRREMAPAAAYLKSGDLDQARTYREMILQVARTPDDVLFGPDNSVHLSWVTQTMSWDLMEACGIFTDDERLQVADYLLKVMRSDQGYRYGGMRPGMFCRENHATRAAQAFYYGWRHFDKYYRDAVAGELVAWRRRLEHFWAACFASSRSYEDSLSQHALGGSLENTLDIALMEPEWSWDFFESGRARRMGERCIAISNNMGDTVLLGDTNPGDYPASVFSKLAYYFRDGRYPFMIDKRQPRASSTDEPLRGFSVGVTPEPPTDHVGLKIIPADDLYFHTALRNTSGVAFEKAFDKLTFRSGFDPEDEYLMLDGVAGGSHSYDDANSIGEYSANGRRWLCEIDIFNGPTMSFHNAVTVARDGLGDPAVPQAAELMTSATGDGHAYAATRLPHYNGIAWTRHMLWLPRKYTLVLDELAADEPGDYSFVLGWRSLGEPDLRQGAFESAQDEVRRPGLFLDGAGLVEAVTGTSGQYLYHLANYGALLFRAEGEGDFVEVKLSVPEPGDYQVAVQTLDYQGRGIIRVAIDGEELGDAIDLFTDGPARRREVVLGKRRLRAGDHSVRFAVAGKNPQSDGHYVGLCGLGLYRAGEAAEAQEVAQNRFRLVFPGDTPATLDRDTETLGKYLPPSPHYDQALNIVEQSLSRELEAGQTTCFQNVFYAWTGEDARDVELRRLTDHCALVKCGEGIALVGAASTGASVELGGLEVSGTLFHVSPSQVILHNAAASLNGAAFTSAGGVNGESLAETLRSAWANADSMAAVAPRWKSVTPLVVHRTPDLPGRPLSLAIRQGAGLRLAVGMENGDVAEWDAEGRAAGSFTTGGPVHALCAADLDGDGAQELLVGSDDEHVYALGPDLGELWRYKVPFLRDQQPWLWWTLDSAKVRAIHADDVNGDGRPEVLLGVGNMRFHCLDAQGKELWRFRTDHGIPTTIVTADVFPDGKRRILVGNGLTSSNGACWVLDGSGKQLQKYFNDSWCTSLPAIAVGDLDADGQQTVFCGNNRGNLRAYPATAETAEPLWLRNLTRPIRSLTVVPSAPGALLAVGSDSGYLCAFDQAGGKAWGVPLSSAISHTLILQRDDTSALLAAGCKDGRVFLVTPAGELAAVADCGGRLEDMVAADVDGDGTEELVAVASEPDRLHVLALD